MELDYQLLAEETQTEQPAEEFEELIRGRYKEQFDTRVQKIIDGRLRNLRQENDRLRETADGEKKKALAHIGALEQSAPDIQREYPDFDWQKEMKDPTFGALIVAGIDGRSAYEMVHRDILQKNAADAAARDATQMVARSIASGGGRVGENGGENAAVLRGDPRSLTSRELSEIRCRVKRGEKIRF